MPWASTAISVGGSLLGGALGGGNKSAERAAKDAAARAQNAQDSARRNVSASLTPYTNTGESANRLLSEYLGTADPSGYAPRPTRQQFEDAIRNEHFNRFGQDYNRNSNMGVINQRIEREFTDAMQKWEAGKKEYLAANPEAGGNGRLLKDFTNEDFVKDPGYNFRLAEGEKGVNRALAARGGFNSGSALKALARYNQDYGSSEFGNAYNRDAANKARIYQFLSGDKASGLQASGIMAGVSQNAANNIGNLGVNASNQVNQLQSDRNMTYANAIQGAIGNLVYGMNRPKDAPVSSVPAWSTPPYVQQGSASASTPWYLE